MKVTLKDGSVMEFENSISVLEAAKAISEGKTDSQDQDRGMAVGFVSENYGVVEDSYV